MKFKIVEEVKKSPEDFDIINYKFRPDGILDIFENVNLSDKNLSYLPFKFGKIDGNFSCSHNNLKDLRDAPEEINGNFWCDINKLISLKGAPEEINGHFSCSNNNLSSLEDAPKVIHGDFNCDTNNLKSLKGAPRIVNGYFSCSNNNNLTSLNGLNLDGIYGKIYLIGNPNLKFSEKEELWMTLNPGKLIL